MADSDDSDQDVEELREPPPSSVNEAKHTEADGDFDKANSQYIGDLSQQAPFQDWVNLSDGET